MHVEYFLPDTGNQASRFAYKADSICEISPNRLVLSKYINAVIQIWLSSQKQLEYIGSKISYLEDALHSWIQALTYLYLNKIDAILQMVVSNAFSWLKGFVFWSKFHWNLFPRVQLVIGMRWFRW